MKKLKTVTVWLVLAFIVLQHFVLKITYYKHIFSRDLFGGADITNVLNLTGVVFMLSLDVLTLVWGIMSLTAADKATADRTYSQFRFIFVMRHLLDVPIIAIQLFVFAHYIFADVVTAFGILFQHAVWITLVILLIICKPEKPVQKVNLQEFDMVAFTSTGHRFVHYLIDLLFLLPVLVSMLQLMMISRYESDIMGRALQVLFIIAYLLYCFLSETIFRQTLGKMVTGSCVVSDGVHLSTGRILRRTMARLIPFDTFSFLFGAKWHDRVSATAVVYVGSWEKAFDDEKNNEEVEILVN